jgi:hypothetical protein
LNPILLSVVGAGVAIHGLSKKLEFSLQYKKTLCKFGYSSYKKILNNIISYLRGKEFDESTFLNELSVTDNILADISPMIDKYEKYYYRKFAK